MNNCAGGSKAKARLRDLLATMTFEQQLAFIRARDSLGRAQDVWLQTYIDMYDAGKFSPEAAHFVSRRLLRLADAVLAAARQIEEVNND